MDSKRMVMDFAEDLGKFNESTLIRNYYYHKSVKIEEDIYNHIVILLTMCVNKELQILLEDKDDDISVEIYPKRVMEIYDEILEAYVNQNLKVINNGKIAQNEKDIFLKYLNHMVKCLLSGIKYIEKKDDEWTLIDKTNEWNTRYRREERIRDYMKRVIAKNENFAGFTIDHCIEIPYMYVLAWDLPKLFVHFKDKTNLQIDSYIENLRRNTSIELRFISENLLDILIHGKQMDEEKWEEGSSNCPIRFRPEVNYVGLLPTISFVEKVDYNNDLYNKQDYFIAKKKHIVPCVKKEVLKRRPLLPMESNIGIYKPERAMEFMVSLMTEENKTKDYQEMDILYFRDCVADICYKLLCWIGQDKIKLYGIENKSDAKAYLREIFDAVNNDPRKNTSENRKDYIKKVVNIIDKKWEDSNLKPMRPNNYEPDTYIRYAYFSVLKLTRNWDHHDLIQEVSMQFCVFLYLISMRYVVEINSLNREDLREYIFLESKLFKLLENQNKRYNYDDMDLEELNNEYGMLYENVNCRAFKNGDKRWANRFPKNEKERKPHQVLNTAGYTDSEIRKEMSEKEIFLSFWLSIHMGENNRPQKVDKRNINIIEILECTYEYQKNSKLLK